MLRVENLEVVYHQVALVLRGVSLGVGEGDVVALLGPNGAGKTTLMRALGGLLALHDGEITKGRVLLGGEDVTGMRATAVTRRGVGQVLEGRRIFADLTVEENLLAGTLVRREWAGREELDRCYERFPALASRRRQLGGYLSGGEQQMLAIGRALMARPRLLLLDEPSLGLAPKVVGEVFGAIAAVRAEGTSVLLVEQNAGLALELARYAYVLENGHVVRDGPSAELRDDSDIQELYLGLGRAGRTSLREVKLYRRRRRWLS